MLKPFDITDITYVKRYVIGNNNPEKIKQDIEIQKDLEMMNKEMNERKGRLLGNEKGFINFQLGEHTLCMQYIVYHIGYKRKF